MKYIYFLMLIAVLGCKNIPDTPIKHTQVAETRQQPEKINGKQVADSLKLLGFFKLTDVSELKESKRQLINSYDELDFFNGTLRGETMDYTDNRFYFIDTEELFEAGGLIYYLKKVKTTFDKLGLKLEFKNEKNIQDSNFLSHTIELNGKEYIAFSGSFTNKDWGNAYLNFIILLNSELKRQGSDEQFYPISVGNDGRMVLLTKPQFDFVKKYYPNDKEHPKTIQNWKVDNDL